MSSKQQINSSSFAGSTPNLVDHSSQVHGQDTQWTVHGSICETPHPPGSKRENHQQWHMSVLDMMWMFQSDWWFGTWMDYDFPFSWECHHPNWRTLSFFRGLKPPTSNDSCTPNMFFGLALLRCSFVFPDLALGDSCVAGRLYGLPSTRTWDPRGIRSGPWVCWHPQNLGFTFKTWGSKP